MTLQRFPASEPYLEELGLEAGEGAADPEVELLAGIHAARFVLVRLHEAVHRGSDVAVGDGREPRPEDGLYRGDTGCCEWMSWSI